MDSDLGEGEEEEDEELEGESEEEGDQGKMLIDEKESEIDEAEIKDEYLDEEQDGRIETNIVIIGLIYGS